MVKMMNSFDSNKEGSYTKNSFEEMKAAAIKRWYNEYAHKYSALIKSHGGLIKTDPIGTGNYPRTFADGSVIDSSIPWEALLGYALVEGECSAQSKYLDIELAQEVWNYPSKQSGLDWYKITNSI